MKEYFELKKKILENEYKHLNSCQREAVFKTDGPMLILAGAGSGKTMTVVNKIAYLIKYGNAYYNSELPKGIKDEDILRMKGEAESGSLPSEETVRLIKKDAVLPYRILAFTFTNKAAGEMRERISKMLDTEAEEIWMGTFHSICVRILRKDIEKVEGYNRNFVIYDTDDQKIVIKSCLSDLDISDREISVKDAMNIIGRAKDVLMEPDRFLAENNDNYRLKKAGAVYKLYQKKLKDSNALDFDDIINLTINLFMENHDVLDYYNQRFLHVFVDEYQDTNMAQYKLISLLSEQRKNLCVVGDDDQSIYGFRGADIRNIIEFEKEYTDCSVIKLEQNYRSTKIILDAANSVIHNNKNRKNKALWTDKEGGEKISVYSAFDERDEAYYLAEAVVENARERKFSDIAVLYRTNAQSRAVEDSFIKNGIPYKIIGGLRFYERREIKDVMAYLRLIQNPKDNVSLKRIINVPKRGIGNTSLAKFEAESAKSEQSIYEYLLTSIQEGNLKGTKVFEFVKLMEYFKDLKTKTSASELIRLVIENSNLSEEYEKDNKVEAQARRENMQELVSVAAEMEMKDEDATFEDFLTYTSLLSDVDALSEQDDFVTLMTMHNAKGLEYPVVFVIGVEEGLFPKSYDNYIDKAEVEEERRLCYVAITRAKEKLFLLYATSRMIYGKTNRSRGSRFLSEIPIELLNGFVKKEPQRTYNFEDKNYFENKSKKGFETSKPGGFTKPKPLYEMEKKPAGSFEKGMTVAHKKFGQGTVHEITTSSDITVIAVDFKEAGRKNLISSSLEII